MLAALETVKDGYKDSNDLENCLGMEFVANTIREQCNSVIEYREKLVNYWLQYHPNPSWESLAERLLYWQENQALENVKRNILTLKNGMTTFLVLL